MTEEIPTVLLEDLGGGGAPAALSPLAPDHQEDPLLDWPVRKVRAFVRHAIDKGEAMPCPVCEQRIARYPRAPYRTLGCCAIALVDLWEVKRRWINAHEINDYIRAVWRIRKHSNVSSDLSKLKYWGLAERHGHRTPDKPRSGLWIPTRSCLLFVRGLIAIPRTAYVYNDIFLGYKDPGDLVTIEDALKERFDYSRHVEEG